MRKTRVWTVRSASSGAVWKACFDKLAAEEQTRALRMRAGVARDEFVTGRALLRCLLRVCLFRGDRAQEPVLRDGAWGKPTVDGIGFNVAHAGGLIAVAICPEGEVGIDVERVDAGVGAEEIAEAHFAAGERAALADSDDPAWEFVRIWTRKEAVVKALGVGLGVALDGFDVTPGDQIVFRGEVVSLQNFQVASGWLGCVAHAGGACEVEVTSLDESDLLALLRG